MWTRLFKWVLKRVFCRVRAWSWAKDPFSFSEFQSRMSQLLSCFLCLKQFLFHLFKRTWNSECCWLCEEKRLLSRRLGSCVFVFSLRLDQLGLWPRWIKLPSSGSRGQSLRVNEWRNCTLPSIGHHSAPHSLTKSGDVHYFLLFLLNTGKQTIILSVSHQNWIVESFNRAVVFAGTVISEFSCKGIHRLCSVHTNWFFLPWTHKGTEYNFFPFLDFWIGSWIFEPNWSEL